jgi:hypothetical protein
MPERLGPREAGAFTTTRLAVRLLDARALLWLLPLTAVNSLGRLRTRARVRAVVAKSFQGPPVT